MNYAQIYLALRVVFPKYLSLQIICLSFLRTENEKKFLKIFCKKGLINFVKFLHQNGANITIDDNYTICWASQNGHFEIVKFLHQNGADLTVDDNYAINWAAYYGHFEVVKYLQENGATL